MYLPKLRAYGFWWMFFRSSIGPVLLEGALSAMPERPVLLVIRGYNPPRHHLDWLTEAYPETDVLLTHLPGMHCPDLGQRGAAAFARAYDEALAALAPERPVRLLALSMGCLVGLELCARRGIDRAVFIEPFLDPANNPALTPLLEPPNATAAADPGFAAWLQALTQRDYRPLLRHAPERTLVLAGDKTDGRAPTVTPEDERQAWLQRGVELWICHGSGHNPADSTIRTAVDALSESDDRFDARRQAKTAAARS